MNSVTSARGVGIVVARDAANNAKTLTEYRTPAKTFHWLTAALIFVMVSSGVIAKQMDGGAIADRLMEVHKTTGILTLVIVLMRLLYRLSDRNRARFGQSDPRPIVHWTLYGLIVVMPLLGWAGASDFGARDVLFGYSLPAIWPHQSGYGDLILHLHAYIAFALLALVALHIGIAMQDYMTRKRCTVSDQD
jgi:cytochrome b561